MISQRKFGDYHLFRLLKQTPLGSTYRAGRVQARAIDRVVLLHLFDQPSSSSADLWERIHHRAPIQEVLDGPLFGRGVELGISSGIPFATYDYRVGRPLDDIFTRARERRMPLSVNQALAIVDQVATALVEAQKLQFENAPILHGALTPELVHVSHRGKIRTFGFDTAPALRSLNPDSKYRSPGIRTGAVAVAADDVFSLAAILFEALTGLPPSREVSFASQVDQALPFGEVSPLAPDLQNLLKHGLAPRDMRTPDVVRWRHELRKVIAGDAGCATEFQLSFFLHALFREELESESHEIQEEKAARWSVAAETETHEETAPLEALVVPAVPELFEEEQEAEDQEEVEQGEAEQEELEAEQEPPSSNAAPIETTQHRASADFWVGLAASLVVATVAAATFFWMGRNTAGEAEGVNRPTDFNVARELIAARAASMEEDLRAEYDPRLARLREQLVTAHRHAASRPAVQAPPPAPSETVRADNASPAPEASLTPTGNESGDDLAGMVEQVVQQVDSATPRNGTEAASDKAKETIVLMPLPEALDAQSKPALPPMSLLANVAEEPSSVGTPSSAAPPAEDPNTADGPVSTPPRILQEPRPRYPRMAQRLRRSATVRLRVLVDETGKPVETELLSDPIGLGFEREAKRAVMASRWTAATVDGNQVPDWVVLKVDFRP